MKEKEIMDDLLGFLKNECAPDFSTYKGHSYIYKMSETNSARAHLVEQMKAGNSFARQTHLTGSIEWRFPTAKRRIFGGTYPGEVERRARKTGERKTTRAQVELLCKYMLFKKGKFTPGKMV